MGQLLNKVHCSEQSKKTAHNTIASCKEQAIVMWTYPAGEE